MTAFATLDGPVRVALVGAGWWGGMWLDALPATDLNLVAIVDPDLDRARGAAAAYPTAGIVAAATLAEVLQSTRVDAILDATPHDAHFSVTAEALRLGLAVLGEKPFAATLPEAVQLTRLAEERGTLLMVSQSRSFNAHLDTLKSEVARRGGAALLSHEFFGRAGGADDDEGFRHFMDDPFITDMAIHHFDAARFVLDDEPVSVQAESSNPAWSWFAGDTMLSATFRFRRGGVYSYTGSRTDQGTGTSWNADWRVSTASATVRWDGEQELRAETTDGVEKLEVVVDPSTETLVGSANAFARALTTGEVPWGIAPQNIPTMAMVHGAIRSARTGRRIDLAELVAEAG